MRGGLALIDRLTRSASANGSRLPPTRSGTACSTRSRITIERELGLRQAIAFFNSFRDLTASGFWSTKMGIEDLQYQGNVFVDDGHALRLRSTSLA